MAFKTKSGLVITLAMVAKSLKADHGYTGKDDDFPAITKFVLDNEIDLNGPDDEPIDLASLKPKATKKAIKIAGEVAPEPKAAAVADAAGVLPEGSNLDEVVRKALAGFEDRIVKQVGLKRPDLSGVGVGKSGAERRYEDKISLKRAKFKSFEDAEAFAGWFYSRMFRGMREPDLATKAWAKYGEYAVRKGFATTTMEAGGATVPEQFDSDLQNLVLQYGVTRQLCRVVRMTSDTCKRPRATGDLDVYYPGEGAAGTDSSSSRTYDQIKGTAKKGVVIAKMSREIQADSAIDIMEDAVESAMRSIAQLEDDTLFNGTGAGASAPADYIPGVRGICNIHGLITSSDTRTKAGATTADAHTAAQLVGCMARANSYVGASWAWVCSGEIAASTIFRLAMAQGGVTFAEFMKFGPTPYAFGYPIVRTPVMNRNMDTATAGTVDVIFGDISLAATFFERQGVEIDVSDQRYWDEDNIGVRAVVRHDLNVHDLGSTSAQGPLGFLTQT